MHLSLLTREQPEMFEKTSEPADAPSREEWLRDTFSRNIIFRHQNLKFNYVPISGLDDPTFIAGRIGRLRHLHENAPPERGLEEVERDAWKAVLFLLDPRHHDSGQKAAIEKNGQVGKPRPIAAALAAHINAQQPRPPYTLEVASIAKRETFWEFVEKHNVVSVTFELLAPNMFGIDGDMDQETRDFKEKENANRVTLSLQNEDGLRLETSRVRAAVNYTHKGGGATKARAKDGATFNSEKYASTVNVSELDPGIISDSVALKQKDLIERIKLAIKIVFGS